MPGQAILLELSGEHPTLPSAEAMACLETESPGHSCLLSGPGFLVSECEPDAVPAIAARLALTHRLGEYLGSAPLDRLEEALEGFDLPSGTLCVRARKVEGLHPEVNTFDLSKKVGRLLSKDHDIDLTSPDLKLRVLLSDRAHLYLERFEIDRRQFDRRKVAERPFFSPISLHPRFARALINLTRAREGDIVLDPFCGTGGIVLEAALMGMRAIGSDIDPEMVEGCRRNLEHFGAKAEVEVSDVGDIAERFGPVQAVATDPPYGRAASTRREDIDGLYHRSLQAMSRTVVQGGRVCVVLPREISGPSLRLEGLHLQRVHRSLTRHYHVFTRW